jgi:hypothetical protein
MLKLPVIGAAMAVALAANAMAVPRTIDLSVGMKVLPYLIALPLAAWRTKCEASNSRARK